MVYGVSGRTRTERSSEAFGYNTPIKWSPDGNMPKMASPGSRFTQDREALNMNVLYLESVHALINQYILAAFKGDLETSLNTLALLTELISPKCDIDDEERAIDNLEYWLGKGLIKDSEGEISRVNPKIIMAVKKSARKIFKSLLHKIDAVGMLTHVPKDYRTVMGDFSDS